MLRHADQLEEQFDEFDRDNSATISVKELGHLMKRCGKEELSKKELQKIVKEVDTDGSGEIGFDEFVEMVISRYAGTRLAFLPGRALADDCDCAGYAPSLSRDMVDFLQLDLESLCAHPFDRLALCTDLECVGLVTTTGSWA